MIDVMLTGVGGQGTVLAAKVLAQAASQKGWHVRTAETIGMAQRGGSVVSHVRMGNEGEHVHAPLVARHTADLLVAFEPAEAARSLAYLAPGGVLVTASSGVQPVTAALASTPYRSEAVVASLRDLFQHNGAAERLVVVDDAAVVKQVGNAKVLNMVLLARALATGAVPLSLDDLRDAVRACVKPSYLDMNLRAIDLALECAAAEADEAERAVDAADAADAADAPALDLSAADTGEIPPVEAPDAPADDDAPATETDEPERE